MELMQRLGGKITDEYINQYIEQIVSHPGSCDNVWIATPYGFPKLSYHKENAKKLNEVAKRFRDNNISVSLQLSNSIGHGEYVSSSDCSGLVYEGSNVECMVDENGIKTQYCFCWRGENFRKYLLEEIGYYIDEIKPDCFWVDDDFRAGFHAPGTIGCFCDNCINEFNKQHGTNYDREGLVKDVIGGKIRKEYSDFAREGLSDLMREISKVVHKFSPKTAMGLQHGIIRGYIGLDMEFLYKPMLEETGITPKSRPGGGSYNDHNPNDILSKVVWLDIQNANLPDYVECRCPEIENLPFVVFGKTPAGTAFETSCYLAYGNTDMSYSMIMSLNEPMEWHSKEFELFSKHRKYWEMLSKYSKKTDGAGMRYFVGNNAHLAPAKPGETLAEMEYIPETTLFGPDMLRRNGFPLTASKKEEGVILLYPEIAEKLSDREIEYLLKKPVFTDAETVQLLQERGYDFGIEIHSISDVDILKIGEEFTEHPTCPEGFDRWKVSFFVAGRSEKHYIIDKDNKTEVLATYYNTSPLDKFTDDDNFPYGISECIVKTKSGAKWGVFGFMPWKGVISYNKREQFLNVADYISDNALSARIITPAQALLLPRKDKVTHKVMSVSVINPTIGESDELEIIVRNPISKKAFFMSQTSDRVDVMVYEKDGETVIKMPKIAPWNVGTVFFE